MTHIEAMKQGLEALEEAVHYTSAPVWSPSMTKECNEAIASLRQAIAEAEKQEPVAWVNHGENRITRVTGWDGYGALFATPPQRTEQEPVAIPKGFSLVAVKGFDELMYWLERCEHKGHLENCPDLIEPYAAFDYRTVDTTPPQRTEQEPQSVRERWNIERDGDDLLVCFNDHDKSQACTYARYVPAPQRKPIQNLQCFHCQDTIETLNDKVMQLMAKRTWVGLTDEEIKDIELGIEIFGLSVKDVLKEAEAKLKQKNQ